MFDHGELQRLYRYCFSLTNDRQNAYDLLHGALEKYLRLDHTPEFPMAYVRRIIRNRFIDDLRRIQNGPAEVVSMADLPENHDGRDLESMAISADLVEQMFSLLSPDEREILYFWAVEGYSSRQLARHLDIPHGTVLSRIYRMRKKLIKSFGGDYSDGLSEVIV